MAEESRAWESHGVKEVRELKWQAVLDQLRREVPAREMTNHRKSAPWKVSLALRMKESTEASNGWLAERLQMGSAFYLSKHVGLHLKKVNGKA